MAIPDFQTLMLPVLRASANGEVKISDVLGLLGAQLSLTETKLSELLPSGKQTTFANRVNWAKSYLGKAGLIDLTRRGYFVISDGGRGTGFTATIHQHQVPGDFSCVQIVPGRQRAAFRHRTSA
jgi:restriction endonuclease Mrr